MTVNANPRRAGPYIGTGTVATFAFSFKTLSEAHLRVVQARTDTDVVIPGVRFDDEARLIHSLGGYVIKIHRPDAPRVRTHESEKGVDCRLLDAAVVNDDTVERLMKNVFAVIGALCSLE